jgi:hypothetical protein
VPKSSMAIFAGAEVRELHSVELRSNMVTSDGSRCHHARWHYHCLDLKSGLLTCIAS